MAGHEAVTAPARNAGAEIARNGAGGVTDARSGHRVLLLIPSYAKQGMDDLVEADRHPTMDYYALRAALGADKADIADYATLDAERHPLIRAARRGGKAAGLAMLGFTRRAKYDAIFANGENVGIPLAALLKGRRIRPAHVLIGHRLSPKKKKPFLRALHPQMDRIFVYAATQYSYARDRIGIPESKLRLIPFHADHRFYRPLSSGSTENEAMICSAGLEWRDYPTLLRAVDGLDVQVRLGAASPWSKHKNETQNRQLPPNVEARRYEYGELRRLYADSRFVVVPLYDNDFQAGVTTILEAMAMGKAVIATRTQGQRDVIDHGENGLYVPPADPDALREAIQGLLADRSEAERIGAAARRTIEERMTLDQWAGRIATVIHEAAAESRISRAR